MKHYSIEDRKALLKEYESSDKTVRTFCARNQISTPTFYYWKNELLGKKTKELVEQAPAVYKESSKNVHLEMRTIFWT